jgi:hypothetical protein
VVLVNTKISAVVPVPVATEIVAEPEDAVAPVKLVSNTASVAVAVTVLPAVTPVRAILRASPVSTELSDGTGSATAFTAVVGAVETATAFTVSAVDAALAGDATRAVVTSATAEAIAISGFLNEVIYSPYIVFLYSVFVSRLD